MESLKVLWKATVAKPQKEKTNMCKCVQMRDIRLASQTNTESTYSKLDTHFMLGEGKSVHFSVTQNDTLSFLCTSSWNDTPETVGERELQEKTNKIESESCTKEQQSKGASQSLISFSGTVLLGSEEARDAKGRLWWQASWRSEIVFGEQCHWVSPLTWNCLNSIIDEQWALEGRPRCAGRTERFKERHCSESNLRSLSATANSIGVQWCTRAISSAIPPKMQMI